MKYILHIGTNKTGTSSLQAFCANNRDVLAKNNISYPDFEDGEAAHHTISRQIQKDADAFLKSKDYRIIEKAARTYGTVLLSSEHFHTHKDPSILTTVFPPGSTQIVVYLREHVSYLRSWYQQAVQARNTCVSFLEFVEIFKVSFTNLLNKWITIYGVDMVSFRLYERESLIKKDLISDFVEGILKLELNDFNTLTFDRNPSIGGNLLILKRMINLFLSLKESKKIVYEFTRLSMLDKSFQGKLQLTEREEKKVAFLYRFDRRELQKKYNLKFNPKLGTNTILDNQQMDFSDLRNDFQRILTYAKENNLETYDYLQRIKGIIC